MEKKGGDEPDAQEEEKVNGLLDWYWYYFHSSLGSITNVVRCHVLALGLKMTFVFLGANIGVTIPKRKKMFCLQETKESKTRIRDEKREKQQTVW